MAILVIFPFVKPAIPAPLPLILLNALIPYFIKNPNQLEENFTLHICAHQHLHPYMLTSFLLLKINSPDALAFDPLRINQGRHTRNSLLSSLYHKHTLSTGLLQSMYKLALFISTILNTHTYPYHCLEFYLQL